MHFFICFCASCAASKPKCHGWAQVHCPLALFIFVLYAKAHAIAFARPLLLRSFSFFFSRSITVAQRQRQHFETFTTMIQNNDKALCHLLFSRMWYIQMNMTNNKNNKNKKLKRIEKNTNLRLFVGMLFDFFVFYYVSIANIDDDAVQMQQNISNCTNERDNNVQCTIWIDLPISKWKSVHTHTQGFFGCVIWFANRISAASIYRWLYGARLLRMKWNIWGTFKNRF